MTHQKGSIYKRNGAWHLRFRDQVRENGEVRTVNRSQKLADVGAYPRKRDVLPLFHEKMAQLNLGGYTPEVGINLCEFVTNVYLPHTVAHLEPSTSHGYRKLWDAYGYLCDSRVRVRDFRTPDAERLLRGIATKNPQLTTRTLQHIKSFFSGAFTHALRQGILIGVPNPLQHASVPKGKESLDTYAYSAQEIDAMLNVLKGTQAYTAVLLAACTGMRESELRGLRWEDYDGETLQIRRKVWRTHEGAPKSRASRAPIPVVSMLRAHLDELRSNLAIEYRTGIAFGPILANSKGTPLNLHWLQWYVMRDIFTVQNLAWHGWHAFRRGLATFLHHKGVDDMVIQRILRHSNVSVTRASYIKTVDEDVRLAIQKIEGSFGGKVASA